MAISTAEQTKISCPTCGKRFDAEVWTLIDTAERPDLQEALVAGTLDQVTCPRCGWRGPAGAPLMVHDPAARRVYFAAPGDAEEHRWREQAQGLLYALVEALPEEARLPYLGDVQISIDVDGLREALARQGRRRGARQPGAAPAPAPLPAAPPPASPPPREEERSPLMDWVQALLAADTPAEFRSVVAEQPALLEDRAVLLLGQLAAQAAQQGDQDLAEALRRVRGTLEELRTAQAIDVAQGTESPSAPAESAGEPPVDGAPAGQALSPEAYRALLLADTPGALVDVARDHPALLEPWADALVAARVDEVLDEGDERLAILLDERREVLAELRDDLTAEGALREAVDLLVRAEGEEPIAMVLAEYPALLTEAAQQALLDVAAGARARGDERLADAMVVRRAMLREVRRGFDGP